MSSSDGETIISKDAESKYFKVPLKELKMILEKELKKLLEGKGIEITDAKAIFSLRNRLYMRYRKFGTFDPKKPKGNIQSAEGMSEERQRRRDYAKSYYQKLKEGFLKSKEMEDK